MTNVVRRSFQAVGISALSNNGQPDSRKLNNCEISPTSEGGINSVQVPRSVGAVLPAAVKWLLITGLMERYGYRAPIAL